MTAEWEGEREISGDGKKEDQENEWRGVRGKE